MDIASFIRHVPASPKPGILFSDITPLLASPEAFGDVIERMADAARPLRPTRIVAAEARGFLFAAPLAQRLGVGLAPVRKPGKLPGETVQESYSKEYGTDTIEIHKDAITEDDIVLLHDDLLATGGTMKAAYDLVKKFNPKKVYVNFLIELIHEDLNGRSNFEEGTDITSLLQV